MTEFAKEYGTALYELCAEEGLADGILQEMQVLTRCFRENPDFIRLLSNLSLEKDERIGILDETLKGRVHDYLLNFLRILTERGAMTAFRECACAYEEMYHRDHQVVEARVTTAKPLTEEQKQKIESKIREMTGKTPQIRQIVDPALLGGVLLEMEGKRYDNTVKSRLKAIRQAMTAED